MKRPENNLKGNILIVDDNLDNLNLLNDILTGEGYLVRSVNNGHLAITTAQNLLPDLILLDVKMPGVNGYTVCEQLKQIQATQEIPIIFLSALDETLDKVTAFTLGAVDYITKPFQIEELLARVENHLNLSAVRKSAQFLNQSLEQKIKTKINQLEKAQQEIYHLSFQDPLTKLANRRLLEEKIQEAIHSSQTKVNYKFAVVLLDIDHFKLVNSYFGHAVADQLLIAIAQKLKLILPSVQTIARLGGDEFVLVVDQITNLNCVTELVEQIQSLMKQPFTVKNYAIFVNFSAGICLGNNYLNCHDLLRDVDIAMNEAKIKSRSSYQVFEHQMQLKVASLFKLENSLRQAYKNQQFVLYYQPVINLANYQIIGFEALLRWLHPQWGLIAPGQFISVAEDIDLIIPIGKWVIEEACRQLASWQKRNLVNSEVKISVNISVKQLLQPYFAEEIKQILEATNLGRQHLILEITESIMMQSSDLLRANLAQIQQHGIELAIDDFGTGYSSLSYLEQFPINTLKIDRSFVFNLNKSTRRNDILKAIIKMANSLALKVIAEGVETLEQAECLQDMGCNYGQGYLFCRPQPCQTMEEILLKDSGYLDLTQNGVN